MRVDLDGAEISFEEAMAKLYSARSGRAAPSVRGCHRGARAGVAHPDVRLQHDRPSTSRSTTASAATRRGSRRATSRNDTTDEAVQALIDATVGRYDVVQRYYTLKAQAARSRPARVLRPHGTDRRGSDQGLVGRCAAARARRVPRLLERDGRHRRALLPRELDRRTAARRTSDPARSARRTSLACTRTCS